MEERFMNNQEGKNKGRIACVVKRDEIAKTVILKYEDAQDNKDSVKISYSTLKRWWKKVKEEEVAEPLIDLDNPITEEEAQEKGMITGDEALEQAVIDPDSAAGDGTSYAQVMQEILEDEKAAKPKKVKKEKTVKPKKEKVQFDYDGVLSQITAIVKSNGFALKYNENHPRRLDVVNEAGKRRYGIYMGNNKCTIGMPKSLVPDGMNPDRLRNCPMAASFIVTYNNLEVINTLMSKEEK